MTTHSTPHGTLIDVDTLAAALRDGRAAGWVLLDCRFDLARPAWGEAQYAAGHIPGAQHAHLDRDLAGPVGPGTGRHPLPAPAEFERRARAWGIGAATQVVVHDQGNGMYAARAWWLFRWLGHRAVAVLDGGFAAWTAAGQPVSTAPGGRARREFIACRDRGASVDAAFVAANLGNAAGMRLVDGSGADRFAGQNETIDPVAGHVPGALNHPFARNVDASGRMRPAAELRTEWLQTLGGVPPTTMVAMCGSGVSACHNLLALEHAGLGGARLYPGSWSEWIRDPSRPVATGPA